MMEFFNESKHTARKAYECEMCCRDINPGEQYYEERGKYEGEFFDRKMHVHCHKMEAEFCSEVDNEFTWWQIMDYIQEKYCSDCEHAACNDDLEGWEECDTSIFDCPKIREIFGDKTKEV